MNTLLTTSLVWLGSSVPAHPGHDHGSLTSGLIHLSLGLTIPAAVGIAVLVFYSRQQSHSNNQEN